MVLRNAQSHDLVLPNSEGKPDVVMACCGDVPTMEALAAVCLLRETLAKFNSETGTIHKLHEPTQLLRLVAQIGLPPQLVDVVTIIPVGKGIAGQVVAQNKRGRDLGGQRPRGS